jgi:hypothetical protein
MWSGPAKYHRSAGLAHDAYSASQQFVGFAGACK